MLIQASSLIGLPVGSLQSQTKIGRVSNLIIDPENGRFLALEVRTGGFWSRVKILACSDILEFDRQGIVTKTEENLVESEEIMRVKEVLAQKIKVLGSGALTQGGKSLGQVYDLLLESETNMVVKYYLKGFLQDRILPAEKVIKIERNKVIFADDVMGEAELASVEEAAA